MLLHFGHMWQFARSQFNKIMLKLLALILQRRRVHITLNSLGVQIVQYSSLGGPIVLINFCYAGHFPTPAYCAHAIRHIFFLSCYA
jgi:hypothetical protein